MPLFPGLSQALLHCILPVRPLPQLGGSHPVQGVRHAQNVLGEFLISHADGSFVFLNCSHLLDAYSHREVSESEKTGSLCMQKLPIAYLSS